MRQKKQFDRLQFVTTNQPEAKYKYIVQRVKGTYVVSIY